MLTNTVKGFPHSSVGKESACNAGDLGSIPGSGRSSGEGNGNPLQYSHLENPMDRAAWRTTVHGITRVGHNLQLNHNNNIIQWSSVGSTQPYEGAPMKAFVLIL